MAWYGRTLRYDVLGSTSDEARRILEAGGVRDAPFVVLADRQTSGRGRGENDWWSGDGSLLFTLALDPAPLGILPRHEPRLALVAAVALVEAAMDFVSAPVGIRWPNDVEVSGRKLAGILPEVLPTSRGRRILIGVGVNVTTRFDAAPPGVRDLATSLELVAGRPLDDGSIPVLYEDLLDRFDAHRDTLVNRPAEAAAAWRKLDLLDGRAVRIRQGEGLIVGTARGIDDDGALRVETDARTISVYGGQVLRD